MQEEAIVIEDNPLDQQINNALVKQNVTDQVIKELKNKYGGLRLKSLDDKESYLEIKQARREVGKVRIIAEKICKAGREDAIKVQRLWIEKQKEVVGRIAEVEDPLAAEEEKFENEIARKEREEAEKREKAFADRQRQLLRCGAQYDHGCYILNHIEYDSQTIKDADDEIWMEIIYPKYAAEYQKNEQARAEEEKKRQQEIELLQKQRDEMEQQQAAFRKQQDELRQQQVELQKKQDEYARSVLLAEQKKRDEELAIEKKKQEDLAEEQAEQMRQQKQREWDEGAAERTAQLERDAREKAEKELQIRQQQLIEKQQEERAMAGDKENWLSLIDDLKLAVAGYQMKSPTYRRKLAIAREKIEEISELK